MGEGFDVIVVGGGLAGSAAAYTLAREGVETLIVERGNFAGAKNMTGGRLYAHCLHDLLPDSAGEPPVERRVTSERIGLLTEEGGTTISFQSPELARKGNESFVVLRSTFDRWLFDRAEEAGAAALTGFRVDRLLRKEGVVCGIACKDEELSARVVIVADGINSPLAQQAGLGVSLSPEQAAVGFKGVFEIGASAVTDRFGGASDTEGAACLFAGAITGGLFGGGFCYPNTSSLSLGLVLGLEHITKAKKPAPALFDEFCAHPAVKSLVSGGKLVEYSAHVISEAGIGAVGKLLDDGVVLAGDAAGFCVNTGLTVRGMDFAITSGHLAARAVIEALREDDVSSQGLSRYRSKLKESYIMRDLELYRHAPEFLDNPRLTHAYPDLLASVFEGIFVIDGKPRERLAKTVRRAIKKPGMVALLRDAQKGMKSL